MGEPGKPNSIIFLTAAASRCPATLIDACARAGWSLQVLAELRAGEVTPAVLAIVLDDATPQNTAQVAALAPATAILLYTTATPVPDDPALFAVITPQESVDALTRWLRAAARLTQARQAEANAREAQDLRALAERFYDAPTSQGVLDYLLRTAIDIVAREDARIPVGDLAGIICLLQDDGRLQVATATAAMYADCPGNALPADMQLAAVRAVETREVVAEGRQLFIPLHWNGRSRGVLMLESTRVPLALPDSLTVLARHASAVLENTILFELAAIDTTTRMFTRAFIQQRLYESLKSTYRNGQDLTVLMMDLDRFKSVNDTYGHLVGDRALHEVGALLKSALRETDVLGRYGGDEFLILLPNTPISGGTEVGRRIRKSVEDYRLRVNGDEVSLGISIGVGGIRHQPSETGKIPLRPDHTFFQKAVEILIAQADGLMYRAKRQNDSHVASARPLSWLNLLQREGTRVR